MRRPFAALLSAALAASVIVTGASAAAAATPTDVFINEIDYNPAGNDDAGLEFVEVAGSESVDLAGYDLVFYNGSSSQLKVYRTQALAGVFDATGVIAFASPIANGIQNGDPDGVALVDDADVVVQFLSYGGSFTAIDGPASGMTSVDIGVVDAGSGDSSVQLTGTGLVADDFAWTTGASSSGAVNTGQVFDTPPPPPIPCDEVAPTLISAVQGNANNASMDGATVTVRGAVTAILPTLNGGTLFVQEEAADVDADPDTSEGIAVVVGSNDLTGVAVDDIVAVEGTVDEVFGNTQLVTTTIQACGDTPETIVASVQMLPATFDERETLEGMLVTTGDATLTITDTFTPYRFGELPLSVSGIQFQPTEVFSPVTEQAQAAALVEENEANLLIVSDGGRKSGQFNPVPWFDDGAVNRAGATNDAPIVGTIFYSFGDHQLQYRDGEEPTFTGDRPVAPDLEGDARIATFNVLNLFNGDGAGGGFPAPRGATTVEAYEAQLDGIVQAILGLDAAVVGLIEIENDYDQGALSSIAQLVDALNAAAEAGGDDWTYVDPGANVGPDEIAVGLIYRTSLATETGTAATFDIDAFLQETGDTGDKNRWPLAQTFDVGGTTVTPVVNHFKSKGSDCEEVSTTDAYTGVAPFDIGEDVDSDLTANCNLTRLYAANEILTWLDTDPTGATTDAYLVGGDLNSYTAEAPLQVLRDAGYVDLIDELDGDKSSYQFGGLFGRLDQLLASPTAAPLFVDADIWQINSPESIGFLYDNEDTAGVFASSDHDPAIAALGAPDLGGNFDLTLLHFNDGESRLVPDDKIGGVARFTTIVKEQQADAGGGADSGVVAISSGDNYLAGPQFAASREPGAPFYDALALTEMGLEASAIGNHEFDFGPDVLADFIEAFGGSLPFVSANLDFTGEPRLQTLVESGDIVASFSFLEDGREIGIVGATTPALRTISSPRDVIVGQDVVTAVQDEIDALTTAGVNIIILAAHLQDITADEALVGQLTGLDVAIAGGGDELLANPGDALLAGDTAARPYPVVGMDADSNEVPIVTTAGNYGYLGRLDLVFDAVGVLVDFGGEAIANPAQGTASTATVADQDPTVQATVVAPVQAFVNDLDANVIATSEVDLDGLRASVRTVETNEGNLLADALLDAAQDRAAAFSVDSPQIAIQNGGGIRNDSIIPAGDVTALDTFNIAPFPNFVAITPDVPSDVVKQLFERAYSSAPGQGGQFAQVAGMTVVYDASRTAQVITNAGVITTPGERIVSIVLDDGTVVVDEGAPAAGVTVDIASNDFTLGGGDNYPFGDLADDFVRLGVSYQQALQDYIEEDLAGSITAADYPEGGEGRINALTPLAPGADFRLSVLHSNDGESRLVPDEKIGGVARFATIVAEQRAAAEFGDDRGSLTISSGDNFLAGPQFAASLEKGVPFYDTIALDLMDYEVSAIGNHEFDFGPEVLADFIEGFTDGDDADAQVDITFVSANLDFTGEPDLQALVDAGTIVASTTRTVDGRKIGIVGATTPALRTISSPRNVVVGQDVVNAVQGQIDGFAADVDIVILTAHLQDVAADESLVSQLTGLDAAIAGGGDELLANDDDLLLAGDTPAREYPIIVTDAGAIDVPIVTTAGNYGYLGRLVLDFDSNGDLIAVQDESGPIANPAPDTVSLAPVAMPDDEVQTQVVDPVAAFIANLDDDVVAISEVDLDGLRADVRTMETNEGNLLADALLDAGQDLASGFGVDAPQIAIQNGGGIRNDSIILAGDVTALDTFNIAPFGNFVAVVPDVPAAQVKQLFERAYSSAPGQGGQFAQVAGMTVVYDPDATAQVITNEGVITTPGERVVSITLDDSTVVVDNGVPVAGVTVDIATNDFTARGGDNYPFAGADFTVVGVTYQQALQDYLTDADDLNGLVTAADYPEGGEGRITTGSVVVEPDPDPTISIDDVTVVEGDTGSTDAVFTVSLDAASAADVTFDVATSDDTATAGDDYTAVATTGVTIAAGATTATVTVPILGDTTDEPDETYTVDLTNITGATAGDVSGLGTITDDDEPVDGGDPATAEVNGDGTVTLVANGFFLQVRFTGVTGTGTVTLEVLDPADVDSPRAVTIGDRVIRLTSEGITFTSAEFSLPDTGLDGEAVCLRLRGDEADDVGDDGDNTGDVVDCTVSEFSIFAAATYDVTRLAGETRIDTAVAISQATFPDGATTAYISRSDTFPDAVAAGPLAAADGAPILLTDRAALSEATRAELVRLGVTKIVALGGPVAIDQAVVDALGQVAPTSRLAGETRYDTAALIAAEQADSTVVYVATGQRFPDALTGGAAAARDGAPVLLVPFDTIPESVRTELIRRSPERIVVLGGPVVIDAAVETALGQLANTVDRVAGETRYDTAALVAATFTTPVDTIHVATGEAFPDALAGVPAAAAAGGPIVLTRPEALTDATAASIESLDPDDVVILGGPVAVSADTEAGINAALIR